SASVDLLFRKDTAGLWSELLAEARGEHAARENAARAALFHGGLRHSVETLRRRSVYFAYEESPLQPAAHRGVRASGAGVVSVAGRRDPARGAPRVPRPRVPADGADRRACAEWGARRRHSQSPHQALARQPVPRARAVQESNGPGVLRRAVLARRAGGPGQGRQHAGRRRRAPDEERLPRVPRKHHRSRHRDHPQRGALLRGLRRLASGRAEKRGRSRLVVGARRRRRSRLPQGHRRHVGGSPASYAPHPGQLSRWNSGRLTLFAFLRPVSGGGVMKRALVVLFSILGLVSCASGPSRPQDLVNRAADGFGGDTWASVKTVTIKGTVKQWEPEQSDVPGGEMRFANEASFETALDRASRVGRTDLEKKFAYPAPRTYKFSEILTPDAGYVIGVDTTARNGQNLQMNPQAHAMSSLRLATAQREP